MQRGVADVGVGARTSAAPGCTRLTGCAVVVVFLLRFLSVVVVGLRRDAYRHDAAVPHRRGVVLTPEDEDPDRDTGQQDDSRDKSPPALYGAEDVLNAQDSSSALRTAVRVGRSPPNSPDYCQSHCRPQCPSGPQFGFRTESRILPSVIPAHSAIRHNPDRPLKVLWLIKGLGAGGAEQLLVQSARYRDPNASPPRSRTCCPKNPPWQPAWSTGVFTGPLPRRRDPLGTPVGYARLRTMLRDGNFDVVHIHSPLVADRGPSGAALVAAPGSATDSGHGAQRLVEPRPPHPARRPADRRAETRPTSRCPTAVRDSLPARIRSRTRVIRYGVDAAAIRRRGRATGPPNARSLGIADDEILVGTVANLRATKGYPDLLAAAARGGRTGCRTSGSSPSGRGPLEDELRGAGDRARASATASASSATGPTRCASCRPSTCSASRPTTRGSRSR